MESLIAEKVIESSTEGIMITDAARRIIYVNPTFISTTGYSYDEVAGKNPRILQSGLQDQSFYRSMWETIHQNGSWQGEIWNKHKDGSVYLEWLTIHAIYENGKVKNYVANFRDITDREKIKKDVELTGELQRKILPADLENDLITIQTIYQPARHVSGDHFGYVMNTEKQKLCGYLYDVMGHGLATAFQSSCLRVIFEQANIRELSLSEKLFWINNEILHFFTEDTFAAAISFEFDFKHKILTYCSSGINKFIANTQRKGQVINVKGSFLGLVPNQVYTTCQIPFDSNDHFYFVSDGLMDILPSTHPSPDFKENLALLKDLAYGQKNKDDASAVCIYIH